MTNSINSSFTKILWPSQLKYRLIIAIGLVHLVVMVLFVSYLFLEQEQFLKTQSKAQATDLAETLSNNANSYIISSNWDALQRLIQSHKDFSHLKYAMVLSEDFVVLAHSNPQFIGLKTVDAISQKIQPNQPINILIENADLLDLAVPVYNLHNDQLGWVRIAVDQQYIYQNLFKLARTAILCILISFLLIALVVIFLITKLINGLYNLLQIADQIKEGNWDIRASGLKSYEISKLGVAFNEMLDAVSNKDLKFRSLVEKSHVGVYIIQHGRHQYVNDKLAAIFGYTAEEMLETVIGKDIIFEEDWEKGKEMIEQRENGLMEFAQYEFRGKRKDGQVIWIEAFGSAFHYNGEIAIIGNLIDITSKKNAEENIRKSKRMYEFISVSNEMILHAKSLDQICSTICDIAVEKGGFKFSWIGCIDETNHCIKPIHWAGKEEGYLIMVGTISIDDIPEGRGPTGKAYRDGNFHYCNDIANDPDMLTLWKENARKRGYGSVIAFPIKLDNNVVYVFTLYSEKPLFFNEEEVQILSRVTDNISYALKKFRINEELKDFSRHLQNLSEIEKKQIAREIHDDLGQNLTSIKFGLAWMKRHIGDDIASLEKTLDNVIEETTHTMESFRRILSSIHPSMLEELGLYETINWLIETFKKNTKISVQFQSNMQGQSLDFERSLALYRTVQESLTNIMRYAKASDVKIILQKTEQDIYLSIEDNGCGFDTDKVDTKAHLGLLGMRERAYAINAKFNLESIIGKGTHIEIKLESDYLVANA